MVLFYLQLLQSFSCRMRLVAKIGHVINTLLFLLPKRVWYVSTIYIYIWHTRTNTLKRYFHNSNYIVPMYDINECDNNPPPPHKNTATLVYVRLAEEWSCCKKQFKQPDYCYWTAQLSVEHSLMYEDFWNPVISPIINHRQV